MADQRKAADKPPEQAASEQSAAQAAENAAERRFPVSRYIAEPAILGQPSHVAAGAFADESPDKLLSEAQARKRIEAFLGREVS